MSLMESPEVPLDGVTTLSSGVFPDEDEGMIVVRDVPLVIIDPPWTDLTEALAGGSRLLEGADYTLSVTEDFVLVDVSLLDPYVRFKFKLPLPEHATVLEVFRENGGLLAVSTLSDLTSAMLLTFEPY